MIESPIYDINRLEFTLVALGATLIVGLLLREFFR